jgi:RNA polymerase sigma-70 factor (ECF subfamily)
VNESEQNIAALWRGLQVFIRARLSDPSLADDLTQEVFVKALRSLSDGKEIQRLDAWMYQVARTTIVDHYRGKSEHHLPLDEDFPELVSEVANEHQQLAGCLEPFIERLPEKYKKTLIEVDLKHSPLKALAKKEGISISAVKSRAARGRKMLKELVMECCHVEMENGLVSDYYRQNKRKSCCH